MLCRGANYRTLRGTKIVRDTKNANVTIRFIDIPCCEMIDEYIFPTPSTPFFTCFSGHVVIIRDIRLIGIAAILCEDGRHRSAVHLPFGGWLGRCRGGGDGSGGGRQRVTLFTALGIIGKVVGVATATSELKVQTCSGSLVKVETQIFVTDARLQSSEMLNQS